MEKAIVEPKVIKLCRRIEPIRIRQEKKMEGNERHMIDEKIVNVYMNFQKISLKKIMEIHEISWKRLIVKKKFY